MASPDLSTTIILSEIILLETTVIIVAGVYFLLKFKNNSKKLADSLKRFTDNENERRNNLTNDLKKPDFIDDEKYKEVINTILSSETAIFNSVISVIHKNDLAQLDSLGKEIGTTIKPCANLLAVAGQSSRETVEETAVIDVDDAIDDLLSDEDNNPDKDPALDLSTADELSSEATASDDEIAEIPSELLESGITDTTDEFDIDQNEKPDSNESTTNN